MHWHRREWRDFECIVGNGNCVLEAVIPLTHDQGTREGMYIHGLRFLNVPGVLNFLNVFMPPRCRKFQNRSRFHIF
jgi:hypothetical protein